MRSARTFTLVALGEPEGSGIGDASGGIVIAGFGAVDGASDGAGGMLAEVPMPGSAPAAPDMGTAGPPDAPGAGEAADEGEVTGWIGRIPEVPPFGPIGDCARASSGKTGTPASATSADRVAAP